MTDNNIAAAAERVAKRFAATHTRTHEFAAVDLVAFADAILAVAESRAVERVRREVAEACERARDTLPTSGSSLAPLALGLLAAEIDPNVVKCRGCGSASCGNLECPEHHAKTARLVAAARATVAAIHDGGLLREVASELDDAQAELRREPEAAPSPPPAPVPRGHCGRCDRCGLPFVNADTRSMCEPGACAAHAWPSGDAPPPRTHCAGCNAPYQPDPDENASQLPPPETPAPVEAVAYGPSLRERCEATYQGGYSDPHDLEVFRHGMATVCNVVEAERNAARDEAAKLRERVAELEQEVAVDDQLLAERDRLLDLFECAAHGMGCVPHAIEEVKRLRALAASGERERQAAEDEARAALEMAEPRREAAELRREAAELRRAAERERQGEAELPGFVLTIRNGAESWLDYLFRSSIDGGEFHVLRKLVAWVRSAPASAVSRIGLPADAARAVKRWIAIDTELRVAIENSLTENGPDGSEMKRLNAALAGATVYDVSELARLLRGIKAWSEVPGRDDLIIEELGVLARPEWAAVAKEGACQAKS